jgi:hypothetical protein
MALHIVYITVLDDTGKKVHTETQLLDFQELLKPDRVAKFYSKATGIPVGQLKVNVIRE